MNLLGPVFWYDLLRTSRRARYFLLRVIYAGLLLFLLWINYLSWFSRWSPDAVTYDEITRFSESFFSFFMVMQFFLVLLLTPAYVGGAIADEKHRKTLEYVMATDLRNREIVFGKLASRLLNLTLFILTGLPIISIMQLFGGVSPDLLWCGFAATALTMLSLSGLSILNSVYGRRSRDAIIFTYLTVICYFALFGLLLFVKAMVSAAGYGPNAWTVAFDYFLDVYNAGNVFYAFYKIVEHVVTTGSFGTLLVDLLIRYAIFHGIIAVGTVSLAIIRLRAVFVRQAFAAVQKPQRGAPKSLWRPHVGDYPMLWKEVVHEAHVRLGWMGRFMLFTIVICCLLPPMIMTFLVLFDPSRTMSWSEFGEGMNWYERIVGTILCTVLFLAVAVRAASGIGAERDRQTFESLLASPLTTAEILFAKWLGSIAAMRWLLMLLGVVWLVGIVTGGLSVLALPVLVLCVACYSFFFSALGLFFSTGSKTTLSAVTWAVAVAILAGGGHWVGCGPIYLILSFNGPASFDWPLYFSAGLTPPAVLAIAAMRGDEIHSFQDRETMKLITFSLLGLAIYVGMAIILWAIAVERFINTCGRITLAAARKPIAADARITK